MPAERIEEQQEVEDGVAHPGEERKGPVGREEDANHPALGVARRLPAGEDASDEEAPHHDPPAHPWRKLLDPEEIAEEETVDRIPRLERLDDATAGIVVLRIEPERLAEVFGRPLRIALVELRPSLRGVGRRVVGVAAQRSLDRSGGRFAIAELQQGAGAGRRAALIFRVDRQAGIGRSEGLLPLACRHVDRCEQAEGISVVRIETDRLFDG